MVLGGLGAPGRWCWVTRAVAGVSVNTMSPVRRCVSGGQRRGAGELRLLFTLQSPLLQNLLCLIKELSLQHLCTKERED